MTDNLKRPARYFDLQLFGEEAPEEGTTSEGGVEAITPEEEETLMSFLTRQSGEETQEEPEPPAPADEPPAAPVGNEEQLILGKFRTREELEKGYLEEQRRLTQYGQQFAEVQRQWQEFLANQQAMIQRQQQPQLSPEEIQKQNEEWLNRFYEKPKDTLMSLVDQTIKKSIEEQVAPVAQRLQYREEYERSYNSFNQQMADARTKYPDFDTLLPEMSKIVQEHGQHYANSPNAVEAIYGIAKARIGGQPASRPIEELIKDPQIRNAVLKSYVQEIRQGKPPSVIGSQPGEIPASPPIDFSQPGSAKKATLSYLSRLLGR